MARRIKSIALYHYRARLVRVVDGDTAILRVDLGFGIETVERVRLLGLDGPEIHKRARKPIRLVEGVAAMGRLHEVLDGVPLVLRTKRDRRERYGRVLGEIFRQARDARGGWESVNALMVAERHAWREGSGLDENI